MKKIIMTVFVLSTNVCLAQLVDQFTDNDFTDHPTWSGHTNHFIINGSQQLQLNNTVASTSFITTPFQPDWSGDLQWDIYVRQNFASSGSNFGRIYLVSDQPNLTQPLNGYYIQLGEAGSNDAVELFRQSGSTHVSICRGPAQQIASAFTLRLRAMRSHAGAWTLLLDALGGTELLQIAAGNDVFHAPTGFFGLLCTYTAGNANRFFYDDVYAGPPPGDTSPPQLSAVEVVSDTLLTLRFSEALGASSVQPLHFRIDGTPAATAVLSVDLTTITVIHSTPFTNGRLHAISIEALTDIAGNILTTTTADFRYFISQPPAYNDIVINEFFPDPSPVIGLPPYEFIEIYNRSDKAFNLVGWTLRDETSTAILPEQYLLPGEYVLIGPTSASMLSAFGSTLLIGNMPTLNNAADIIRLADAGGVVLDSVRFNLEWYHDEDKAQGGFTIERLGATLPSNEPTTWHASVDSLGGTPGKINSVDGRNPDQQAPVIVSSEVQNASSIIFVFSESIDTISLQTSVVLFQPSRSISSIAPGNDERTVIATLGEQLTNGEEYNCTISGIRDLAGNVMTAQQLTLLHFTSRPVLYKDVIVSEIMADPAPVVGLPEAEYVEIHNRSDVPFDLTGWWLCDSRDSAKLPHRVLPAHQYLIVTSTTNATRLASFGKMVAVSSFPSLANDGEPLRLIAPSGLLVDSVYYSGAWHSGAEKREGGWSIELIDPSNPCGERTNWTSSEDERGGTPGQANSVMANKPDVTGPELQSVTVADRKEIVLVFNEKLSRDLSLLRIDLSPDTDPFSLSFSDVSLTSVRIRFETALSERTTYRVDVRQAFDCAGNNIGVQGSTVEFAISEPATRGDVIINELLFNPHPGGVDFIELLNTSPKFIELRNWTIVNQANNDSAIIRSSLTIPPGGFTVFTADPEILSNFYPASDRSTMNAIALPALGDDEGVVVLKDSTGAIIDELTYHSGMHHPLLRDVEGVSLERISAGSSSSPGNWRSATASSGGATPGRMNSNDRPAIAGTGDVIELHPLILSRASGSGFVTIGYQFDRPGNVANVNIYDLEGRLVKELANNEIIGPTGFLRWDGDISAGAAATTGYYVIRFQVFDTDGRQQVYREKILVTR